MVYFPDINIDFPGRNKRYDDTDITHDERIEDRLSFRLLDNPSNLNRISGNFDKLLETGRASNRSTFFKDEFDPTRLAMYRARQSPKRLVKVKVSKSPPESNENESVKKTIKLCQQISTNNSPEKPFTRDEVLKLIDIKIRQQKRYIDQKIKSLSKNETLPSLKKPRSGDLESIIRQL
jgi:hypothetical protein